jgi:hypothetical protein
MFLSGWSHYCHSNTKFVHFVRPLAYAIGVLSFFGLGGIVQAQPRTAVALDYEVAAGANGCPDADQFRASVERQLGYDPFRSAADKHIAVQIAPKDSGFEGHIRWSEADGRSVGERRLSSRRPECREIAASVAFAVAVQIQLIATLAAPAPEPPPAPPEPVAREPEVKTTVEARPNATPPPPQPEPATPPEPLGLYFGLGPALALGVAPQPTALGRMFVSGRRSWLSFEVGLDAALPVTQHQADGSGFSLRRFAAGAAACGHLYAFAACALATVGLLQARGVDVDVPASPTGLFSQLGARVAATRALGRYFVAARFDALVMTGRWTVALNQSDAWTTPRVGALIGVDLGARFF